jgi:hypothetical protein
MDVPTFFDLPFHCSQIALANVAMTGSMDDHLIRRLYSLKGMPTVACLSSWCFAARRTFLPLALEAIAGWRLAAVLALFRQSPFSLFDPQERTHQQPFEFLNPLLFSRQFFFEFRVLFSQLARFFFLHARRVSALSSPFQGT